MGTASFPRLYGLSIDYLVAADIVIRAKDEESGKWVAKKVTATIYNEYRELMWGIRGGGGGQFGVICRLYFNKDTLPDAPDYVYVTTLTWTWKDKDGNVIISRNQWNEILEFYEVFLTSQEPDMWQSFSILHATHMDADAMNLAVIGVSAAVDDDLGVLSQDLIGFR